LGEGSVLLECDMRIEGKRRCFARENDGRSTTHSPTANCTPRPTPHVPRSTRHTTHDTRRPVSCFSPSRAHSLVRPSVRPFVRSFGRERASEGSPLLKARAVAPCLASFPRFWFLCSSVPLPPASRVFSFPDPSLVASEKTPPAAAAAAAATPVPLGC
jgi:hypothetical protein